MVSTVRNTDIEQKDAERAVVVAMTFKAVFGSDDGDEVYGAGVAFTLLQALQTVNERLLLENPSEMLLFDVILITTDRQQQQQSDRIMSSTRHHGLQIHRFCFSCEDDFTESLLQNKVQLFLSTDQNETEQAASRGVLSALVDHQTASCSSQQLRVVFCGDSIVQPDTDTNTASRHAAEVFSAQLGEMRRRFGVLDSPLSIVLMTSSGGRDSCGNALRTLRTRGLSVDEAHCLAGAPRGVILSLLRPHFQLGDGLSGLQD